MSRRRILLTAATAGVTVTAAAVWLALAGDSADTAAGIGAPAATATVERGSIEAVESWDGTLGRGEPFTVRAGAPGTVTRLAAQGATVERGQVLVRVDERPVVLLVGVLPMYRDLGPGASGVDVEQLEANLVALGYGGLTPDQIYDETTAAAVRTWQERLAIPVTGTVTRRDVVVVPEGRQVGALRSGVGDPVTPGTPLLDVVGRDQVVTVQAEVDDLDHLAVDTEVTVELPGDQRSTGTIRLAAVADATSSPPSMGDESGAPESILSVEVALAEAVDDELVGAPVEVVVPVDERRDVLLVPVNALLARAEGGYALEVVDDDGSPRLVPVETGLFAEGRVEVSSPDVEEGAIVGVAER